MKKNIMLRLSAVLLVAVLLTTCVISGTWAKYVENGEANATATVAKWGVEVNVTGNDAFGKKYNDTIVADGVKVISNRDLNVLAPGTNGDLGSVTITGKPEVMVSVSVSLDIELENWKDANGDYYCPLIIGGLKGLDYDSADAFEAAIEAKVNKSAAEVAANTDLASTYNASLTWQWAYESVDGTKVTASDVKDSFLGDQGNATITVKWTASVTQVN